MPTSKRGSAKKRTAKKATAKKGAGRRPAAKKGRGGAKKATAKKATAKRGGQGRGGAAKKATAKRSAAKKSGGGQAAKKGRRGGVANPAFMREMQPSAELAAVVGERPMPRTEITKRVWDYIKSNGLQDQTNRRMINADDNLRAVFGGRRQVSMFEMTKLINDHLS
jgi:chromatin remodeling complex protein RSC6